MVTIELNQGYFRVIEPKTDIRNYFDGPQNMLSPDTGSFDYNRLPPIHETYLTLKKMGLSSEAIMERLLKYYHRQRRFRAKHLTNQSLIIGLVGVRGSGKSAGMTNIVIFDYLLCGYKVWSNMNIGFRVKYKDAEKVYSTIPLSKLEILDLDEVYADGVLAIDEINMEIAEAHMSMSKTNRIFSYFLQQLRKRRINILFTAQNEMWCDARLRWQTDLWVLCRDAYLTSGFSAKYIGERSIWKARDYSGVVNGGTGRNDGEDANLIWSGSIFNRPWWNCYNTFELQGKDDYRHAQDTLKQLEKAEQRQSVYGPAMAIVGLLEEQGITSIWSDAVFEDAGFADDRAGQMAVSDELKKAGFERKKHRASGRYYYEKQAEMTYD